MNRDTLREARRRHRHRKKCRAKEQLTEHEADALAAKVVDRNWFVGDRDVNSYLCPFCGHWHIGHSVKVVLMTPYQRAIEQENEAIIETLSRALCGGAA